MFPEDSHGLFFFRDVKQEENLLMFLCGNEPENRSSNSSSGSGLVAKSFPTREIAWAAARQAPLPTGFSRQEYWSGLPFPSPGHLPQSRLEPVSPAVQADSLPCATREASNRRQKADGKAAILKNLVHSALKGMERTGPVDKTGGHSLGPRWTFPIVATMLNFKNWYGPAKID